MNLDRGRGNPTELSKADVPPTTTIQSFVLGVLHDWKKMGVVLAVTSCALFFGPLQQSTALDIAAFVGLLGSVASTIALLYGVKIFSLSSRENKDLKDQVGTLSDGLRPIAMDTTSVRDALLAFLTEVEQTELTVEAEIWVVADMLPFGRLLFDTGTDASSSLVSENAKIALAHNKLRQLLGRPCSKKTIAVLDGYLAPGDREVWVGSALRKYQDQIVRLDGSLAPDILDAVAAHSRNIVEDLRRSIANINIFKLQELPFQAIVVSDIHKSSVFVLHVGEFNIEGLKTPASMFTTNANIVRTYRSVVESFITAQEDRIVLPHRPEDDPRHPPTWTSDRDDATALQLVIRPYVSGRLLEYVVLIDDAVESEIIVCMMIAGDTTMGRERITQQARDTISRAREVNKMFKGICEGELLRLVYDVTPGGGIFYGRVWNAQASIPVRHLVASVREQHTMDAATARVGQLIDELRAAGSLPPWIRRESNRRP